MQEVNRIEIAFYFVDGAGASVSTVSVLLFTEHQITAYTYM